MNRTIQNLRKQLRRDPPESQHGLFPAGHYYSPIPSEDDVLAHINLERPFSSELPGIRLNAQGQREVLNDYVTLYADIPFPEKQTAGARYYYANDWFSYSDAIFLYSFLRHQKPRRIIEVGSGFSSAVMLDTVDGFFAERPEITFIEPYPDRLMALLRGSDKEQVRIIDRKIQDVPAETILSLESGDLLYIDSSHVVKCGSDLQRLMFDILPHLKPGVFVHFHDVFYPFEYPSAWLKEGRYWNENYFLRAFLSYNSDWRIHFFNTYVHLMFGDLIEEQMPLCAKNAGGSLYIQRELNC